MLLAEIRRDAIDHGVADLVEIVHLGARLLVVSDLSARFIKRLPRSIAARERARRGLAYVAHSKRIDESLERDFASRLDRVEQVAH